MLTYTRYQDKDITSPKFFYLVASIKQAASREALLDWFTSRQRPVITDLPEDLYKAQMVVVQGSKSEIDVFKQHLAVYLPNVKLDKSIEPFTLVDPSDDVAAYGVYAPDPNANLVVLIRLTNSGLEIPFRVYDQFKLGPGMIDNYKDKKVVVTDVGKFVTNQIILVFPFGDKIPYMNSKMDTAVIDNKVAEMILNKEIGRKEFNKYMDYGYWYLNDGSLFASSWSEKYLSTDPNMEKKKKELFDKYRDKLDDPIVVSQIEQELIAIDKAWLKGDVAEPYTMANGKKVFNEQRKKMFITFGLMPAFDKVSGKYEMVETSLASGVNAKDVPILANEIRRGAYSRGRETAKGGEQTKFILRIFQNVQIQEDDCGTKQGIKVFIDDTTKKLYVGRYLVDGTPLTPENMEKYMGKYVTIRSPMYCKSKPGYCYKCCGELFKKLDMKAVGLRAISITEQFTSTAMSSMHSSSLNTVNIERLEDFLY